VVLAGEFEQFPGVVEDGGGVPAAGQAAAAELTAALVGGVGQFQLQVPQAVFGVPRAAGAAQSGAAAVEGLAGLGVAAAAAFEHRSFGDLVRGWVGHGGSTPNRVLRVGWSERIR